MAHVINRSFHSIIRYKRILKAEIKGVCNGIDS